MNGKHRKIARGESITREARLKEARPRDDYDGCIMLRKNARANKWTVRNGGEEGVVKMKSKERGVGHPQKLMPQIVSSPSPTIG
jgi:hypothetical protein